MNKLALTLMLLLPATAAVAQQVDSWTTNDFTQYRPLVASSPLVASDIGFNVRDYGARGDGSNPDDTAILAAINAAKASTARGGTIYFPPGVYVVSAPINLQLTTYMRLVGAGGMGPGFGGSGGNDDLPPSTILYKGGGTDSFIQLNGAFGSLISHIGIVYDNPGFSGNLIDYGYAPHSTAEATYNVIEDALLGSNAWHSWGARTLISWNHADYNIVRNSHLEGAYTGVRFRESVDSWANGDRIEDCMFRDFQTAHIMNASNQDVVTGNVFEGILNQGPVKPGGTPPPPPHGPPTYSTDISATGAGTQYFNHSLVWTNNWSGDVGNGEMQFDTSPFALPTAVTTINLTYTGNYGGTAHFGPLQGATISHNGFEGDVTFDDPSAHSRYVGVTVEGNVWFQGQMKNPPPNANVLGNGWWNATTPVNDQMTINGPLKAAQVEPADGKLLDIGMQANEATRIGGPDSVVLLSGSGVGGNGYTKTWNNFYLQSSDASIGSPLMSAPRLYWWTRYWNFALGVSTEVNNYMTCIQDTTAPTEHCELFQNDQSVISWNSDGAIATRVGNGLAAAYTIAPVADITNISNTNNTVIHYITPPPNYTANKKGGTITLVFEEPTGWAGNTSYEGNNTVGTADSNIMIGGNSTVPYTTVTFTFNSITGRWYPSRTR